MSDDKTNGVMKKVPNRDVTGQAEVFRLQDFVSAGVVQNGFGMYSGLMSEGAIPTTTRDQ